MSEIKSEKIKNRIREIVAEYISRETNGKSLISVTTVDVNDKADNGTIFITVIPESEEDGALNFLKRKRTEIKKYIQKRLPIAHTPFIDFAIDEGEKLSQKITKIEIQEKNKNQD